MNEDERRASNGADQGHVVSSDGTRIAYWRSGAGSPIVLVHGGVTDHTRWARVAVFLERHHTVYAIDRRGRGRSKQAVALDVKREYEDVVAMAERAGPGTTVVGHSIGATIALEAALRESSIARVVLFEPPWIPESPASAAEREEIFSLLDCGETERAFRKFLGRTGIEPAVIEKIIESDGPRWSDRIEAASAVLKYEMSAQASYVFEPRAFRTFTKPVLVVNGGLSSPLLHDVTQLLLKHLPDVRTVVLRDHGHGALTTGPEVFAEAVLAFVRSGV